jgi:aspartate aminotransferase
MVLLNLSRSALRQTASSLAKKKPIYAAANVSRSMSTASPWAHFEMAPLDPIIGLNESFAADDFPQKVIVGVGAYRDDSGKPYVLPCVREAEKIMMSKNLDMEYAGIVSIGKCVPRKRFTGG